jgi:BlaR1 peptidase M56
MDTTAIHLDTYHPHLLYTLGITILTWGVVGWYSEYKLREHPSKRVGLCALAISLPLYGEAVSFLMTAFRPAPWTLVGRIFVYVHTIVIQFLPIDKLLDSLLPPPLVLLLAALLVGLAASSLARYCCATLRMRQMLAGAIPLRESAYSALATRLPTARGVLRPTPPILVAEMEGPLAFAMGVLRPRIYVSAELLDLLTIEEARGVLCHEWAHILRRDLLWNWFVRLLRDMSCFLPGSHVFWRSMITSQDEACDLLAIEMTRRPLDLARALIKVAAAWRQYRPAVVIRSTSLFASTNTDIQVRVEQMIRLSDAPAPTQARSDVYILGAVLMILSMLPVLLGC